MLPLGFTSWFSHLAEPKKKCTLFGPPLNTGRATKEKNIKCVRWLGELFLLTIVGKRLEALARASLRPGMYKTKGPAEFTDQACKLSPGL